MLIALFAASRKQGRECKAHKRLVTMLSVIVKPGEAKSHSWSSCPGQRAKVSAQTWALVSAKLRGVWSFKAKGRSLGNSCCSFLVRVVGCTGDGVGLFLVVHLQHVILIFNSSAGEERKCRGLK